MLYYQLVCMTDHFKTFRWFDHTFFSREMRMCIIPSRTISFVHFSSFSCLYSYTSVDQLYIHTKTVVPSASTCPRSNTIWNFDSFQLGKLLLAISYKNKYIFEYNSMTINQNSVSSAGWTATSDAHHWGIRAGCFPPIDRIHSYGVRYTSTTHFIG